MAKVDVRTEIEIQAPIEKVATYASNPVNAPTWYVNINKAEWVEGNTVSVGSKISFQAAFLGKVLNYTYEIVEYIPNESMIMRTAQGPFPMETTYTFEKINNETTLMKLRNAGKPSGFSALFAPFMKGAMRRANNKDLAMIKEILESMESN